MHRSVIQAAVIAALSEVTEFPGQDLEAHLDADLVSDLGVDSLKLAEVWAIIESRLGLELGDLAVAQRSSVRHITDHVAKTLA